MSNNKECLSSNERVTKKNYFNRLRCINPVNVWYVTSLCKDIILYMNGYRLHIWAIGSTVTGVRPQRDYPKPQDIDILVTHDRMLDDTTFENQHYFLTEFEEMFLRWVKAQSTRFEIIESGFEKGHLGLLGSGDVSLRRLGGAWLVPKVWSHTPINLIVPSESKGGKEELEKIRHGDFIVLHPET